VSRLGDASEAITPSTRRHPTSILIVEDHRMVADAFAAAFDLQPDLAVVGHATTIAEAERLAASTEPDVVVVDFRLPDGDGAEAIERIRRLRPQARTLVVTSASDDQTIVRCLRVDADGYLLKDQPVEELLSGVRAVAAGGSAYAPALIGRIVAKSVTGPDRGEQLSDRELEVLQQLALGSSTTDMAAELHISVNTVRNHVQRVLMKLEAHTRIEAVAAGIRAGYIQPPSQDQSAQR
jgi:DNA-binding NarL/FixJ family response regulator